MQCISSWRQKLVNSLSLTSHGRYLFQIKKSLKTKKIFLTYERANFFATQTYSTILYLGGLLTALYIWLSFWFLIFYNIEFRTYLIGQRLEKPIRNLDHVDFWKDPVFFIRSIIKNYVLKKNQIKY